MILLLRRAIARSSGHNSDRLGNEPYRNQLRQAAISIREISHLEVLPVGTDWRMSHRSRRESTTDRSTIFRLTQSVIEKITAILTGAGSRGSES